MKFAQILRQGLVAGVAAGLTAAVLLWLVVEPVIRRALAVEEARSSGHHGHGEALVSRGVQVAGGAVTVVVVGALFGVLFAVVFARVRDRLPGHSDFTRSAVLGALGFFVLALVPAVKIPANPPAVGDPETVTERTLVYALSVLLSAGLVLAVAALNRYLHRRGTPESVRYSVAMYAVVAGMVAILVWAPSSPDTVPGDVPASLLWDFRVASLAQLGAMWAVLAATFGLLVHRRREGQREVVPAPA